MSFLILSELLSHRMATVIRVKKKKKKNVLLLTLLITLRALDPTQVKQKLSSIYPINVSVYLFVYLHIYLIMFFCVRM